MRTLHLAFAAMLAAGPASAAFEDHGTGARATGLGGAFTAVADDVYSIYYNPAGLATLDRRELGTSYSRLLTGLSDGSSLQSSFIGYAHPLSRGRDGALGAAWQYTTLDSLYRESSLFLSYGRRLNREDDPAPLFAGVSTKILQRSLGGSSAASNGLSNTGVATGQADPVLQSASATAFDADLGLLWRPLPRWSLGAQLQHVLEPNVAFAKNDQDKLARGYRLGTAYRTPFSTLSSDVSLRRAPDGSADKAVSVAAEKWLPTLLHGSFGVRGALALGSRDLRQLATGLSYRVNRMQFDYGFALPIGGFRQTSGTHRLGLSWRFGAPARADQLLGQMLLENLASAGPVGSDEFNRQAAALVGYKRRAIDALMRDADALANLGRFAEAHQRALEAASLAPKDALMSEVSSRYRTTAAYFPDHSGAIATQAGAMTHDGLMKFLAGRFRESLASLKNARQYDGSGALDAMIRVVEATVELDAPKAPVEPPAASTAAAVSPAQAAAVEGPGAKARVAEWMEALMEVAFAQKDWGETVRRAQQLLELEPGHRMAFRRLAGAQHALNRPAEALKALRSAYALETDEEQKRQLASYIDALKALVEKARAPERAAASPEEVERLYEAGVALYAEGRLGEALAAFKRCLELQPDYAPARRARQRVEAELKQSGR